jgi:hypothetical protein
MFPFFLFSGIAALLFLARGHSPKPPSGTVTVESITTTRGVLPPSPDLLYLRKLAAIRMLAKQGVPIPSALLDDAITEAYERGDWKVVAALTPGEETPSEETASEDTSNASPEDASRPIAESPIDAASTEEWNAFLDALKTESPSYSSERYFGSYHQNKERLDTLGIDAATLADESSQRQAIATDLSTYREQERKLIDDFGGEVIDVNGQTHGVSMSGILGLLKAAGPKHTRSWLKNPDERSKYPQTTETFLRTNNIF